MAASLCSALVQQRDAGGAIFLAVVVVQIEHGQLIHGVGGAKGYGVQIVVQHFLQGRLFFFRRFGVAGLTPVQLGQHAAGDQVARPGRGAEPVYGVLGPVLGSQEGADGGLGGCIATLCQIADHADRRTVVVCGVGGLEVLAHGVVDGAQVEVKTPDGAGVRPGLNHQAELRTFVGSLVDGADRAQALADGIHLRFHAGHCRVRPAATAVTGRVHVCPDSCQPILVSGGCFRRLQVLVESAHHVVAGNARLIGVENGAADRAQLQRLIFHQLQGLGLQLHETLHALGQGDVAPE